MADQSTFGPVVSLWSYRTCTVAVLQFDLVKVALLMCLRSTSNWVTTEIHNHSLVCTILVLKQPPRPTQPGHLLGDRRIEFPPQVMYVLIRY